MKMQEKNFIDKLHRWGRIWGVIALIAISSFPFLLMIIYQTGPEWNAFFKGFIAIVPMFWAVGIIEIFTYVPMIGVGASYLSFVTGNITNLKAPVAMLALEKAEAKAGTEEGEVISTMAVAVSSIVTTLIIAVGVIIIVSVKPVFNFLNSETMVPVKDNVLPALFGGLAVVFISKNPKLAIGPIILMLLLFIFVPVLNSSTVGIMVPVGAVFTILIARILYKKGIIGNKQKGSEE